MVIYHGFTNVIIAQPPITNQDPGWVPPTLYSSTAAATCRAVPATREPPR